MCFLVVAVTSLTPAWCQDSVDSIAIIKKNDRCLRESSEWSASEQKLADISFESIRRRGEIRNGRFDYELTEIPWGRSEKKVQTYGRFVFDYDESAFRYARVSRYIDDVENDPKADTPVVQAESDSRIFPQIEAMYGSAFIDDVQTYFSERDTPSVRLITPSEYFEGLVPFEPMSLGFAAHGSYLKCMDASTVFASQMRRPNIGGRQSDDRTHFAFGSPTTSLFIFDATRGYYPIRQRMCIEVGELPHKNAEPINVRLIISSDVIIEPIKFGGVWLPRYFRTRGDGLPTHEVTIQWRSINTDMNAEAFDPKTITLDIKELSEKFDH